MHACQATATGTGLFGFKPGLRTVEGPRGFLRTVEGSRGFFPEHLFGPWKVLEDSFLNTL